MKVLESLHFATTTVLTHSGQDHQWMLKPLDESLLGERDSHKSQKHHTIDY